MFFAHSDKKIEPMIGIDKEGTASLAVNARHMILKNFMLRQKQTEHL